ncbi:MAG: hypothetical protein KC609_15125 [Myxococcales bacterium]|nr:hypothetical protein [Myxococcales bacterium]
MAISWLLGSAALASDRPAPLLVELENRIAELKAVGKRAAILLDLPSALFETCPREIALLEAFARDKLPKKSRVRLQIGALDRTRCTREDAVVLLRSAGVRDEKLLAEVERYARQRRGTPAFAKSLVLRSGAATIVQKWRGFGVQIIARVTPGKVARDAMASELRSRKLSIDHWITIAPISSARRGTDDRTIAKLLTVARGAVFIAVISANVDFLLLVRNALAGATLIRIDKPRLSGPRSPITATPRGIRQLPDFSSHL